jgi:predicted amino acid-binding ACT domain protein
VATATEVRALLAATTLPAELVDGLVDGVSPMWLMGEPAEAVAADLALCYPALGPDEVRAAVHPTSAAGVWRISIAAHDRTGLLARISSALTSRGLNIVRASLSAWPQHGIAVGRLLATGPGSDEDWEAVGAELRAAIAADELAVPTLPGLTPVTVDTSAQEAARTLVRVGAPDRVGLLWGLTAWFASRGCNIEVAKVESDGAMADGTFVVDGDVDAEALATYLSGVGRDEPGRFGSLARRWRRRVSG